MASSHLLHSPLPKSIPLIYILHPPSNLGECELEPGKLWPRIWAFRCEGQRKNRRLIILSVLKRAWFCSLKMNVRNGRSGDVKTARERRAWILNAIFMGHCTSCFALLILKLSQASASSPRFQRLYLFSICLREDLSFSPCLCSLLLTPGNADN